MVSRLNSATIIHSGFADIANLFTAPVPSLPDKRYEEPSKLRRTNGAHDRLIGIPYESHAPSRTVEEPRLGSKLGKQRESNAPGAGTEDQALRKRKVDKRIIGPPTDFRHARHIFHASTYEEATELLLRWSIEGVGDKIGDPSWANPIKQLVKFRAKEQQARAVAAVVEATVRGRLKDAGDALQPPGTLRVVNGLPSSIYSSVNTALTPLEGRRSSALGRDTNHTSIPSILARASTPNLIANFTSGYFDAQTNSSNGSKSPTSPLTNPFNTPVVEEEMTSPRSSPGKRIKATAPLVIKRKSVPPIPEMTKLPGSGRTASPRDLSGSKAAEKLIQVVSPPTAEPAPEVLPFRIIKPSLETLEKSMSVALFFEQYYHGLLHTPRPRSKTADPGNYVLARASRLAQLEATFVLPENRYMSEGEKQDRREALLREENRILRERRKRVDVKAFELGRVIGHGAFGVVRIARERESGRLVAMKQLRKADMLRKSQEGHVKAEKDLLVAAASKSLPTTDSNTHSWIVRLYYAFQDTDHLYLILEYMGGGDLLNLLVDLDMFSEDMTRFYVAEMILALEETHSLGYIHRDIKPDNFLFTPTGHIRISDFGLATDLHWAHDTNHYEQQRQALLKKHGIDLELSGGGKTRRMKREDVERVMGKEWIEEGDGMLTWRDKNRKRLAYSVCGTNSYMAPEVIRGQGYGFSCDWWSLGIIMYESLYGYPPFVSSSRHITRQKILNWKKNLKFPPSSRISPQCTDFMARLLCEPEDRIGSQGPRNPSVLSTHSIRMASTRGSAMLGLGPDGAAQLKAHPWFASIDWDTLHEQEPPYAPDLYADDDTRHFDENIPNEPLAPAHGGADHIKDPLLKDKTHGAHLLEIRKSLAFKGWTFKSPHLTESRYGHMAYVSSGGQSHETVLGNGGEETPRPSRLEGTVRSRALSL